MPLPLRGGGREREGRGGGKRGGQSQSEGGQGMASMGGLKWLCGGGVFHELPSYLAGAVAKVLVALVCWRRLPGTDGPLLLRVLAAGGQ